MPNIYNKTVLPIQYARKHQYKSICNTSCTKFTYKKCKLPRKLLIYIKYVKNNFNQSVIIRNCNGQALNTAHISTQKLHNIKLADSIRTVIFITLKKF